jgi:hypothetical protein
MGGEKKIKKLKKLKKKIIEKLNHKKIRLKRLIFFLKTAGLVRFRFYKPKTKKKSNRTQIGKQTEPKLEKTEPK